MDLNIICIIPARKGSKGIKDKNKVIVNEIPLITYTLNFVKNLNLFKTVCISTNDDDIINIATKLGFSIDFKRPESLSEDNTSSFEVIKHAISYYSERNINFDYVCLLQPTVPIRDLDSFTYIIKWFTNQRDYDTLLSVRKLPHAMSPEWLFKENDDNSITPFDFSKLSKRRQHLENFYYRDGSLYLFNIKNILMYDSIYGKKIFPFVNHKSPFINIDTQEDLLEFRKIINKIP